MLPFPLISSLALLNETGSGRKKADNVLLLKGQAASSGHSEFMAGTGRTGKPWEGSELWGKQQQTPAWRR